MCRREIGVLLASSLAGLAPLIFSPRSLSAAGAESFDPGSYAALADATSTDSVSHVKALCQLHSGDHAHRVKVKPTVERGRLNRVLKTLPGRTSQTVARYSRNLESHGKRFSTKLRYPLQPR